MPPNRSFEAGDRPFGAVHIVEGTQGADDVKFLSVNFEHKGQGFAWGRLEGDDRKAMLKLFDKSVEHPDAGKRPLIE